MATEYSLLTWAGLGTTVTFTVVGNIVNFTAHGAPNGHAFRFTTTGTLPTGLTAGTTYYLRQGTDANKFTIYPTQADAIADTNQITFIGTGTGTNQVVGEYWAALDTAGRTRYGTAGSERVYGRMADAATGINAKTTDYSKSQHVEVESRFLDIGVPPAFTNKWKSITVSSTVKGVRSDAYHYGVYGAGYICQINSQYNAPVSIGNHYGLVDGLDLRQNYVSANCVNVSGALGSVINTFVSGSNLPTGVGNTSPGSTVSNVVAIGCGKAFPLPTYTNGYASTYKNCLAVKGDVGFVGTNSNVSVVGCISVGNTTNWGVAPTNTYVDFNIGETADTVWGINPLTTGSSGMFLDYDNNDFRPALVTSPQVELITLNDGDGLPRYDIADAVRPNYEAASFPDNKATAGPFEFDHGEGTVPNYKDITLTGLITGSRVKIKKTSDGTSIYNDIVSGTTLTVSYNLATDTAVTIDIRKGSAAPFYYPYRTTATVSALTGLNLTISQGPDIARGATYRAGIADDWNPATLEHIAGATVDDVQDLYSYLCDYYDAEVTVDLDIPMYGTTPTVFGVQNSISISDADMQYLKCGSIQDGTTLWSNVYTVGSQSAGTQINVRIDGAEVTPWWSTGNIDVLIKLPLYDGTEVIDIRAQEYSDTYDHWQMTVTDGRNVAAISTFDDPDNQTANATVATWSDITVTVDNPVGKTIDASDTPADYTITVDSGGRPIAQVYERLKYLTAYPTVYVSANAAYAEVKTSPYGTFAAGVFSGARGVWVENVASGDALNYILTDNAGTTHQAAVPPVQIAVTNIVAGSVIQIYDVTNSTQLDVDTVAGTSYSLEKAWTEDLTIRVRLMKMDGVTAYEFYEVEGVFTSSGMNLRAAQALDPVYNANAIDGSAVTGVTIDDGLLLVQVATGSISWQQLYAYETYWLSTAAGIIDEGRFAQAVDVANYLWYDFKLKNVTFPSVPLVVTGGYGKDGDTGTSLSMLDTSGGTIILAPDHVVPYSSGAEATVAIVQAGLQAQGYTTTRAPKLDNLDIPVSEAGGGGGLTEEQNTQLMRTLTKSQFVALK